jgi:hypothetical protein
MKENFKKEKLMDFKEVLRHLMATVNMDTMKMARFMENGLMLRVLNSILAPIH